MTSKINFNEYTSVDTLDAEEKEIWQGLRSGAYESVMTDDMKKYYAESVKQSVKRDQASTIRLTLNDKILAHSKAREEGLPYQVLLSSIIHKWLHGKLVEVR